MATEGKPTPTQAENDAAAEGNHVREKEPDGSGPEVAPQPVDALTQTRTLRPEVSGGGYRTRQSTPRPAAPPSGSST